MMKKEPANLIKTQSFDLATYARGDENSPRLALVLPGRLDTKDYIHMTSHVDLLAGLGFYAVSFDPPFSWESPGDIRNYTTTNYLKAVDELIKYYGNRPTLLIGHSRGGAVAMLSSENPNIIGLVLVMANYNKASAPKTEQIHGEYTLEYRDTPPGAMRTKERREFHLPLTYFSDAGQYEQADKLRRFLGPKLLICGSRDKFIPAGHVKEVYDSLMHPKEFLELDTEHDYRVHPDMLAKVNVAIKEFVERYI